MKCLATTSRDLAPGEKLRKPHLKIKPVHESVSVILSTWKFKRLLWTPLISKWKNTHLGISCWKTTSQWNARTFNHLHMHTVSPNWIVESCMDKNHISLHEKLALTQSRLFRGSHPTCPRKHAAIRSPCAETKRSTGQCQFLEVCSTILWNSIKIASLQIVSSLCTLDSKVLKIAEYTEEINFTNACKQFAFQLASTSAWCKLWAKLATRAYDRLTWHLDDLSTRVGNQRLWAGV